MNNPYEFNPKGSILDDQLAVSGIENDIFGFIADVFTGGAYTRNKNGLSVFQLPSNSFEILP